jgi:acetylornithine deacetylase/succinyl-diaminopimelate desuccinylase-like protein
VTGIERAIQAIPTDRVVELARAFCSIPSPGGEEGRLAEAIADTLSRPGIDVHLEEVVAGRPNVIATVPGAGQRPPLVLNGHLDAGVHGGRWSHDPHDPWIDGGRMYAGGITDMKGAVAAMTAAIEAAAGVELPGDLIFQAVMHHDGTGLGTKYALASEGPREGFAICGEPSSLAIHTANGGALKFEVTLSGRSAHISRQEESVDTLPAAVQVYRAINAHSFAHEPHPRLPKLPRLLIGQLIAGEAPASVADSAVIRGDIRTVPGMDRRGVRAELAAVVDAACPPQVRATVRILSAHQPFIGVDEGPLVDAIAAAHEAITGDAPRITSELPGQAFVTDAASLAGAGLATVVYGAGDWHYAPDEWIDITELADSARVYLAVAMTLGTLPAGGAGTPPAGTAGGAR